MGNQLVSPIDTPFGNVNVSGPEEAVTFLKGRLKLADEADYGKCSARIERQEILQDLESLRRALDIAHNVVAERGEPF